MGSAQNGVWDVNWADLAGWAFYELGNQLFTSPSELLSILVESSILRD
jgi:hypothetical protein